MTPDVPPTDTQTALPAPQNSPLTSLKELLGRRTRGEWQALDEGVCLAYGGDWIATTEPDGRIARYEAKANALAITALSNAADELVAVAQAVQARCNGCKDGRQRVPARDGNPAIHPVWGGRGYNDCSLSNAEAGALSALYDALGGEGQ